MTEFNTSKTLVSLCSHRSGVSPLTINGCTINEDPFGFETPLGSKFIPELKWKYKIHFERNRQNGCHRKYLTPSVIFYLYMSQSTAAIFELAMFNLHFPAFIQYHKSFTRFCGGRRIIFSFLQTQYYEPIAISKANVQLSIYFSSTLMVDTHIDYFHGI